MEEVYDLSGRSLLPIRKKSITYQEEVYYLSGRSLLPIEAVSGLFTSVVRCRNQVSNQVYNQVYNQAINQEKIMIDRLIDFLQPNLFFFRKKSITY